MLHPNPSQNSLTHSIIIQASPSRVEHTITDLVLMQRWLNPMLICEPIGTWSTAVGSRSRFCIQVPIGSLTLENEVIDRGPGLVVWQFDGFFRGTDRWDCHPVDQGTELTNTFSFQIPNPLIRFGFHTFAATWTARDMRSQLQRLKTVAESVDSTLSTGGQSPYGSGFTDIFSGR
jgi:Polyketide cyclase / dehydrase and lipid transport